MLQSMTGYGSASDRIEGVELTVEIRAVNNRFLKPTVRLPEHLSGLETEIEQLVRRKLSRGTVSVSVQMKVPDEQAAGNINTAALNHYIEQLRLIGVDANPMLRIDLGAMLMLPGIVEPPLLEELAGKLHEGLTKLVLAALDALTSMRIEEGKAVRADLESHCAAITEMLGSVVRRAPDVVKDYHERLAARVEELTLAGNLKIDEESLAREVAVFAERCDIAEEVARLRGHVEQFSQALTADESVGRKLDFIAQEMLREANTIASKANDVEIVRTVVEIKTAIDRIKEQVQNVE